ncbi:hypothetical protein niasHS_008201 [Heterodera schachtii]|uniref:G-protein coupled receptors family 1 profile domain-containing protein n=1 Tax=Heterodera schachtii TaxID=97005 RepID=A0ABD2J800_HETSC
MSSNELYDLYKDAGHVPTEILTNGILAAICFSGITLNMLLVYVTVKSKSLRSSCNILITFYAFSISFILIGDSVPFFVFLFGINFISLQLCFYIQIIPLIFAAFAISLQLCIGIDRLVGISFPIWYKMGGSESENNKALMFSLSVIMSIGLICYIGTCVFFNFIMPLLGLNFLTIEYIVWPICNGLGSMACSSCTPVLFLCSTDYRKAFCKYLRRTEHQINVVVPLRIMPASDIRA